MQENISTSPRLKYFVSGLLANAMWGFMALPLRALVSWSADTILYFRVFVSCVFVWLFIFLFRFSKWQDSVHAVKALPVGKRRQLLFLVFLSALLIIGNWYTFIYAINNVSIKSAAFAYLVCPLITTLAGYFILKEKLTSIKWISLVVALVSVIMLAQTSLIEVVWSVIIASFYAFYLIIQRILGDIDKFNFLAVQVFLCSLLILPLFFMGNHVVPISTTFWVIICLVAVVFTIIPLFMSMYALNGIASATMGILIYVNPVISFAVAIFFFNEVISFQQLIAYLLLIAAIALYNSAIIHQFISKFAKRGSV